MKSIGKMTSMYNTTKWLSINLDDTVSGPKDSFEEACYNKSHYIAEQNYYSQSWSGQTSYFKYKFYSPDGEITHPKIGNCEVLTEVTQSYYAFDQINEFLKLRRSTLYYPLSLYGSKGTFNECIVTDNEGKQKKICLANLVELLPFLRKLSIASCWQEFKLIQFLELIKEKTCDLKSSITKWGYSSQEFAFEYGSVNGDQTFRQRYFTYDFTRLKEALDSILEETSPKYQEENKYTIEYLQKDLDYISKVLEGEKAWRRTL